MITIKGITFWLNLTEKEIADIYDYTVYYEDEEIKEYPSVSVPTGTAWETEISKCPPETAAVVIAG